MKLGLGCSIDSGNATWTPARFGSALAGWWAADRGTLYAGDNTVTSLPDLIPSATNPLSNATSTKRPLYTAGSQNNRPGLLFDGVDDGLFAAANTQLSYERTQTMHIFIVAKSNRVPAGGIDTLLAKGNPLSAGYGVQFTSNTNVRFGLANGAANRLIIDTTTGNNTTARVYGIEYDGTSVPSGVRVRVDGALLSSSTAVNSLSATIINTSKFGIGFQDTTLGPFGGLIYEGFILTSVASAAMRVRAERYLKSKWGTA